MNPKVRTLHKNVMHDGISLIKYTMPFVSFVQILHVFSKAKIRQHRPQVRITAMAVVRIGEW